ncbi:DNA damage-responsive transcriptional repressor RPH1 [Colletotrichum aenigma]|uniref:DNA damage-responsive transcriptional repressor RPH1 n=1 Tax=Colletotrichum aenigma TaxID=1215731 RepID=UPI0018722647|nr:DNA damage-responsive transcriptional repressor RPH1 [Colletotrichum aenigma]KAF5521323.1 DNA damage-responsive transcriptional repressor RPH1 [Colletotrichum aenigma]
MDIASKLRDLEMKLQHVTRIVSTLQLSTPHAGRRTRRNNPRQTTKPTSALDELKDLLTGLYAELQKIQKEISRTSEQPSQEPLPADAASPSSALSSPPPSVGADEHSDPPVDLPAPSPRVVDVPTHQETVPSPPPDAGGPRTDLEPPSAVGLDSAAPSPLSDLGSDVEWALQHAESLLEAQGESPTDPAPPEPAPITTRPKFSLTTEEMGVNLVPNIAKMVSKEDFTGKVRIANLPEVDWATLESSIGRPKDREHLGNVYTKGSNGSGYAFLKLSPSTKFVLPDFSQMPEKPPEDEITAFLDDIANDPPKGSIPYYAGPPLTSSIESFLHPGDALASMEAIAGGNSPYVYIGAKYSGTGWHDDDALLWSCNYVSFGWKLWLVVAEHHRAKFEAFVRRHWKANRCAQFVRHLSLFIGPSRLRKEGIDFVVHCAGPGDMVIIRPGQYHAVVNFSSCFATAINFSLPGDRVMPPDLAVCKQCGLYPLQRPDFRVVSPPPLDPVPGVETEHVSIAERIKLARRPAARPQDLQPAKKPKTSRPHPELDEIIRQVLKIDKLCHIPRIDHRNPPSPEVLKLAMAIGSRPAIQQFCDLVRSRRDPKNDRTRLYFEGDLQVRITQRLTALGRSQRRSNLERLMVRLDQYYLACDIEQSKQGRLRADSSFLDAIAKKSHCPRDVLSKHVNQGNKWMRLCRERKELLCFIFLDSRNPFGVFLDAWMSLQENDVDVLHRLLSNDYIASLCTAAAALMQSIDGVSHDVEFVWEMRSKPLCSIPEEDMLLLLRPIPQVAENVFEPGRYPTWPRPAGWPEHAPWPADPTSILDLDSKLCEFCEEAECKCLEELSSRNGSRPMPRIKDYGALGRGLQATANQYGQVAYRSGDVIGILAGEIAPVDTFDDSHTLEFVRPDLPDEPVVCQIRCVEVSNIFRLLNHSCRPSAKFEQLRASGRYVTAVRAARDITDGEQITVSYGSKWTASPCLCDACQGAGDTV